MNSELQAQAEIEGILSLLGYDKWQLLDASYNGCNFTIIRSLSAPLSTNSIANAIKTTGYYVHQIFGSGNDFNQNTSNNLFNTNLGITEMEDRQSWKVIDKDLPYANGSSLENMGSSGWDFNFDAIFFGSDYAKAYHNFLNACYNPPKGYANQLVHPVRGLIQGITELCDIKTLYRANDRKAIVINLAFKCESSLAWDSSLNNNSNDLNNAITAVIQTVNAFGTVATLGQFLQK